MDLESKKIAISNRLLGLTWQVAFRANYSPKTMRRNFDRISGVSAESLLKKYPSLNIEQFTLGGVAAESIEAATSSRKTILYLHGGGFFMGSILSYRRQALRLAYTCKAKVVVVDYRLAPEHPFPAGLDDILSAYRRLIEETDPKQIILAGDSAGGGLVFSTLLSLRDKGLPLPGSAVAISPWADLTGSGASLETNRERDLCLNKARLLSWAPWYAKDKAANDPLISPVFGDFTGFPKLLLMVGADEVLLDDAIRLHAAAQKAGVSSELLVPKQMQHDWLLALPWLMESKNSTRAIRDFING